MSSKVSLSFWDVSSRSDSRRDNICSSSLVYCSASRSLVESPVFGRDDDDPGLEEDDELLDDEDDSVDNKRRLCTCSSNAWIWMADIERDSVVRESLSVAEESSCSSFWRVRRRGEKRGRN
jgi:hypothetical protein